MAVPNRPFTVVPAPARPAVRGGLVNVVDSLGRLVGRSSTDIARGIALEASFICGAPGITAGLCETDASITQDATKDVEEPVVVYSPVFTTYRGVEAMPSVLDYEGLARESLTYNETLTVERAVQEAFYIGSDYTTRSALNGGAAIGVAEGLALLDQTIGSTFGFGLIHMDRETAVLSADATRAVKADGLGWLGTVNGTPIVNGAGYSNVSIGDVAPAANQFWAWATAVPTLFQSEAFYNDGYDLSINKETGVAERLWAATLDCPEVYAVLLDTTL